MKKCLIIINESAGGSKRISAESVKKCLGGEYDFNVFTLPRDGKYSLAGYDAVAACGGDGTLANVMSEAYKRKMEVFYFPAGTLNDKAKAERYYHAKSSCPSTGNGGAREKVVIGRLVDLSSNENSSHEGREGRDGQDGKYAQGQDGGRERKCGEHIFTYVLAAGSFTPIGYTAKVKLKKRLGVLAYVGKIFKEYRVHRIKAEITAGEKRFEGEFTLVMFVKSPRCFGFSFNKAFDPESESGHLVAIRSPKHGGALGLIEMFFPFFRVFFLGLKKEREGKIVFRKISNATLLLKNDEDFCSDGELKRLGASKYKIDFVRSMCDFAVIEKF